MSEMPEMPNKNAFGLEENVASGLCYVLAYVTGIVFLIAEKENKTIRFHALQSIVWFGGLTVLSWVIGILFAGFFSWFYMVGRLLGQIISLAGLVSWIYLMYKAFTGNMVKLPVIGDAVWEQINK